MKLRGFILLMFLGFVAFAQNTNQLNGYKYLYVKPEKSHEPGKDSKQESKLKSYFISKGFYVIANKDSVQQKELITVIYKNVKEDDGSNKALISRKKITIISTVTFAEASGKTIFECTSTDSPKFGDASYELSKDVFNASYLINALEPHFVDFKYTYSPNAAVTENTSLANTTQRQSDNEKPVEKPAEKQKPNPVKEKQNTKPVQKVVEPENTSEPGAYYALLIGVSDYADPAIPDLDNLPIKDAEKLAGILLTKYTFEKENVTTLKNPNRRDLVIALDDLSKKITPDDNVLIFYAGHGHYEEDNQIGYWLPKDAEVANTSNWLYNDQLVASIKKIKSKHTLLITDACFSGSIFKTRSISMDKAGDAIKKKYELPSRKAITSGTLKTVPNVSVFMKYLTDRLTNNKEKYFSASQLFQSIEIPVGNNSPTTPQYGVIQNVGDEGGDFIFIKK